MASDVALAKPQVFPCDKSGIPRTEQSISYEGRELSNEKATMEGLGVSGNAVLLLRRKISVAGRCASWIWYAIPGNITPSGPQDSRTRRGDDAIADSGKSRTDAFPARSTAVVPFRLSSILLTPYMLYRLSQSLQPLPRQILGGSQNS